MKTLLKAVAFMAVFAAISPSLFAQWPPHRTRGVPRTSTGEPDLNGPTPRTSDGKPDFSGIWQTPRGAGGQRGGGEAAPAVAPETGPPVATFGNAGSGFKDGLPYSQWARSKQPAMQLKAKGWIIDGGNRLDPRSDFVVAQVPQPEREHR